MRNSHKITLIAFSLFLLPLFSSGRLFCGEPTVEEIMLQVQRLFQGIEDYTVEVIANIDMPGLRAPEMRATLYYQSPGRIHVESSGLSILPREGISPNPRRFEERYIPQLEAETELEGRPVYRVRLLPRPEYNREFETVLLIDKERFLVRRIQKLSVGDPFLTVDFKYELVEDRFFLPSESRVELVLASMPGRERQAYPQGPGPRTMESLFSEQEKSPPKNGYATVRFEGYRVNIGLPDSLFEQPGQTKTSGQTEKH